MGDRPQVKLSMSLECVPELGRRDRVERDKAVHGRAVIPAPEADIPPPSISPPLIRHRIMNGPAPLPEIAHAWGRALDRYCMEMAWFAGKDFAGDMERIAPCAGWA